MTDYCPPDPLTLLPVYNPENWIDTCIGAGGVGSQGPQGILGISGLQGRQGIQGSGGTNGSAGVQGNQGNQGVAGSTGTSGSGLFYYNPGSTGNISITFNDTTNAYYEINTSFWQTGATGTITVTYAGIGRSTTILENYGIIKMYLNNNNTGNGSKLDYELISNSSLSTFQTPTYQRYAWVVDTAFPKTLTITAVPLTSFYYTVVKRFSI